MSYKQKNTPVLDYPDSEYFERLGRTDLKSLRVEDYNLGHEDEGLSELEKYDQHITQQALDIPAISELDVIGLERLNKIRQKAYDKVAETKFVRYFTKVADRNFNDYIEAGYGKQAAEYYKQELDFIEESKYDGYMKVNKKLSPQSTLAIFVTFAPDREINFHHNEIIALGSKVIKLSKGVSYGIFCVEHQNYDDDKPTGIHFHALIKLNKDEEMGQVNKQLKRISSLLGDKYRTKTDRHLDIRKVGEKKLDDKIAYIKGEKIDQDKLRKVVEDKDWRKFCKIPDYFENGVL